MPAAARPSRQRPAAPGAHPAGAARAGAALRRLEAVLEPLVRQGPAHSARGGRWCPPAGAEGVQSRWREAVWPHGLQEAWAGRRVRSPAPRSPLLGHPTFAIAPEPAADQLPGRNAVAEHQAHRIEAQALQRQQMASGRGEQRAAGVVLDAEGLLYPSQCRLGAPGSSRGLQVPQLLPPAGRRVLGQLGPWGLQANLGAGGKIGRGDRDLERATSRFGPRSQRQDLRSPRILSGGRGARASRPVSPPTTLLHTWQGFVPGDPLRPSPAARAE